jgi:hypothetical protein
MIEGFPETVIMKIDNDWVEHPVTELTMNATPSGGNAQMEVNLNIETFSSKEELMEDFFKSLNDEEKKELLLKYM